MVDEKATPQCLDAAPRRRDLLELGDTFKEALKPVGSLVPLMQQQNVNSIELLDRVSAHSKRTERLQRWMFVNTSVALSAIMILMAVIFSIRQVVGKVDMTAGRLESMAATVSSAKRSADETRAEVAQVSSAQASQSRVELVPETDPEKAEDAPVRVRIVAPAPRPSSGAPNPGSAQSAPQPPPAQSIEFPIPRESFKGDPAKP